MSFSHTSKSTNPPGGAPIEPASKSTTVDMKKETPKRLYYFFYHGQKITSKETLKDLHAKDNIVDLVNAGKGYQAARAPLLSVKAIDENATYAAEQSSAQLLLKEDESYKIYPHLHGFDPKFYYSFLSKHNSQGLYSSHRVRECVANKDAIGSLIFSLPVKDIIAELFEHNGNKGKAVKILSTKPSFQNKLQRELESLFGKEKVVIDKGYTLSNTEPKHPISIMISLDDFITTLIQKSEIKYSNDELVELKLLTVGQFLSGGLTLKKS